MLKTNKIYNIDCLEGMRLIENESIDLILTDPPYGVLPKGKIMRNKKVDKFEWDNVNLVQFTKKWFELAYKKLKNNSFMFIFWSQKYFREGFEIFNPNRVIFWRYNNLINNPQGDFAYDYEPIFVVKKGNPKLIPGKHSCDLEFTKPQSNFKKNKLVHPAQKPLELIKHLITISSKKNDIVLDMFLGSGTTTIACKQLERRFVGFEINPEYTKINKERLEKCYFQHSLVK
ncbi:MAG: DNA-methyltransferase [Candidatus Heimdallarchaeaceae archaeon]